MSQAGALGEFAASSESAFGTIMQRVMSWPGVVRLHYGHPDVFNKLLVMTGVGAPSRLTRLLQAHLLFTNLVCLFRSVSVY